MSVEEYGETGRGKYSRGSIEVELSFLRDVFSISTTAYTTPPAKFFDSVQS